MAARKSPGTTIPINGPAVRRIRMEKGIEPAELAARIGVHRSYVTRIELGEGDQARRVSLRVHMALRHVLGVSGQDLIEPLAMETTGAAA